jgi:hypothetical protein
MSLCAFHCPCFTQAQLEMFERKPQKCEPVHLRAKIDVESKKLVLTERRAETASSSGGQAPQEVKEEVNNEWYEHFWTSDLELSKVGWAASEDVAAVPCEVYESTGRDFIEMGSGEYYKGDGPTLGLISVFTDDCVKTACWTMAHNVTKCFKFGRKVRWYVAFQGPRDSECVATICEWLTSAVRLETLQVYFLDRSASRPKTINHVCRAAIRDQCEVAPPPRV